MNAMPVSDVDQSLVPSKLSLVKASTDNCSAPIMRLISRLGTELPSY